MKKTALVAASAALALLLAGCAPSVLEAAPPGGPSPAEPSGAPEEARSAPPLIEVPGKGSDGYRVKHYSILCMEGSAFLYVYGSGGGYQGGPAMSRFAEMDEAC